MKELTASEIANILSMSKQNIRSLCRCGKLKVIEEAESFCKTSRKKKKYTISIDDFCTFLCENPNFRLLFYSAKSSDIVTFISKYLNQRTDDFLFSITDVCRICDVTPNTVRRWISVGYLISNNGIRKFSRKEIESLFEVYPKAKRYMIPEEIK